MAGCGRAGVRGSSAAIWVARLGSRVPLTLCRVLARTRQCVLGRHVRGNRLSAQSRRFAAQSLVPHDRHRRWSGGDRGPDRMLPAKPHRFSHGSCRVGRCMRLRRHDIAQLRVVWGGTRWLHSGGHRQRSTRCDRGRKRRSFHVGLNPRQRDLHRNCLRGHCGGRDRFRPSAGPTRRPIRRPFRRGHRRIVRYARRTDRGGDAIDAAGSHPTRHRARADHRRSDRRNLRPALSLAGIAGGGWGPVCRPVQLAHGRQSPRTSAE